MIVRAARPGELDELGELTVAAYRADGYLDGDDDFYVAELRDAARRAELATLLVAVDEPAGRPVGTVTFCVAGTSYAEIARPGEAEFRMLAVSPSARGRGVGERLVRACIDRARAAGSTGLALSSLAAMRPAHRIYERLGFHRAPDRDWDPAPGVHLVGYLLPL